VIDVVAFEPSHGAGVIELILGIQQREFGIAITLDEQPDLSDIRAFYQHGRGNFWVALDGARVVGTIALRDIGERQVALRKMFVDAAYRGGALGVAARLLEAALRWARESDVREVLLGTTAKFVAAHRFYEKNGFREIARETLPASFPLMTVDTKFYSRTIADA
jgi:N-acetylglutamate synthase-like GNAT family acetyltransferase